MKLSIELKKLKSTGLILAILTGGMAAALLPVLNTWFRTELFTSLPDSPLVVLLDANSQMMIMLNLILMICGSCILYHTEYSEHALRKMLSLPITPESLYLQKAVILILGLLFLLILESSALVFCTSHWFTITEDFWILLLKSALYSAFLSLPSILLMLLIASACQNMWVSLGTGVIFLSLASSLTEGPFLLRLCPFITPFQTLVQTEGEALSYIGGAAAEILILGITAVIFTRRRRYTI